MTFSSRSVRAFPVPETKIYIRLFLNKNIPLISGKYGLRNHFWPLESRFLTRKSEKNAFFDGNYKANGIDGLEIVELT